MVQTASAHRSELVELARLAGVDLASIWGGVSDPVAAERLLREVAPALVDLYGTAAGAAAAEFYDELREEARPPRRFRAIVADLPTEARYTSLAEWATQPLRITEPDPTAALQRATRGLERSVKDVSRQTIMGSSITDPAAVGWKRLASSGACGFCRMLADRGAVYSQASVGFGAHDNCSCVAVPAFGGDVILTDRPAMNTRTISDADRARTREWMRANGY